MKKAFLIAVVAIHSLTLKAASITEVKIVQLWPWSTDVKITYNLSSVEGPVDVQLKCYDGKREIVAPNLHNAVSGDMYGITTDGEKKIILKPQKAFAASIGSYANFNVKLTVSATPANGSEVVYKIFDLNGKSYENVTRNDLKNGKYGDYENDFSRIGEGFETVLKDVIIWTAVTNGTTYKKDKLVMRKIPVAGEDKLWTIGSPVGECGRDYNDEGGRETQHTVKLTEDYFIGVFEITQSQALKVWSTISGTDTSEQHFSTFEDSEIRPYTGMTFNTIRGMTSWGASSANDYPKINWPTNSPMHTVFHNRFAGKMRSKFSVDFDLPTSAQWEIACRAGTATSLNSGKEVSTVLTGVRCPNVDELAWNGHSDYFDAPGGTNQTRAVGLKKPNAFGLYDMHGNAEELCLDVYTSNIAKYYDGSENREHQDPLVDPVGPVYSEGNNPQRTYRGGSYARSNRYIRSAFRDGGGHSTQSQHRPDIGFRLVMPAADSGWAK